MKEWEVQVVASSLPSVQNLCLNEGVENQCYDKSGLPTLDVLSAFARHCPKLANLGLLVDAFEPKHLQGVCIRPLSALQSLSVGKSYIGDRGDS